MLQAIRNALRVPDLRNRIIFTLAMITVYRLGCHVPVPGVNIETIKSIFEQGGPVLGWLDVFAGGALSEFAVFALGIMPYITSSIIMQLLTVVIPTLENWMKEGEVGQRKITQWTRLLTLALALLQSTMLTFVFQRALRLPFNFTQRFVIVVTLVAGTALIMWLGELITQRGIGNGMSLLIFSSIISYFPSATLKTVETNINSSWIIALVAVIVMVAIVAIILIERGQRRLPVQYAKRIIGRRMTAGGMTYIPLKVNSAGVIPIIFASSVLMFPAQIAQYFPGKTSQAISSMLSTGSAVHLTIFAGLIIFFTYFYTAIIFNPIDTSDNLRKYGAFIPGVRPGRPTALYIDKVLTRITLPGSIFLALIAVLPTILMSTLRVPFFQDFGGTSLLITVGVALETMNQLESQLLMRHYEGFLK